MKYDDTVHKSVANGLVTCDYKSKCKYTIYYKDDGTDKVAGPDQDCFCSLSAEGTGYCPYAIGDAGNSARAQRVIAMFKANYDGHHTQHRYQEKSADDVNSSICQVWAGSIVSQGALDCVKTAFGAAKCAANYITTAIVALLMVFLALF